MVYNDQRDLWTSNRHVQGTQVIHMKVQHLMAKGAWKNLQDDMRGVWCDFEDIPNSKGPTQMSDSNRVVKDMVKVALVIYTLAQD
jgi:hypothetical protein